MSGLAIIIGHTTASKVPGKNANVLTPQRVKANPTFVKRWKSCDCVRCVVREAAVKDDMFCAGSSRSYCYFVPLRRT